jgi:hypothetical protein
MIACLRLQFIEAGKPIRDLVTKFGGEPVWLTGPQWPVSRSTGELMRFICQIRLEPVLFGELPAQIAYLFITDPPGQSVHGTWDPEAGENAIVLQPGSPTVEVRAATGRPTLCRMVKRLLRPRLVAEPGEWAAALAPGEDPDFIPEQERLNWEPEQVVAYLQAVEGNKLGGTPGFLQGDQFPTGGPWKLLLQLDSTDVPFSINFGDAGIGYGFLARDGSEARFLWQCA